MHLGPAIASRSSWDVTAAIGSNDSFNPEGGGYKGIEQMMMKIPLSKNYIIASAIVNFAAVCMIVGFVAYKYPVSHVGFNPWRASIVLPVAIGALFSPLAFSTWRRFIPLASWVGLLTVLVIVNAFNMLVQHPTWGMRGLPDWGEFKIDTLEELKRDKRPRP